jgi:hypothetical protein
MNTASTAAAGLPVYPAPAKGSRPHLDKKPGPVTAVVFVGLLAIGLLFTGYSLVNDVTEAGALATTWVPYILLGVALLIALGFEFVHARGGAGAGRPRRQHRCAGEGARLSLQGAGRRGGERAQ